MKKTKLITAAEAYDIAHPKYDEYIDFINKRITEAAQNGRAEVVIRENEYAYWLYEEKKMTADQKKIVEELRDNGFTVDLYYQELQFVDIGLRIAWDKKE